MRAKTERSGRDQLHVALSSVSLIMIIGGGTVAPASTRSRSATAWHVG
jgi:hypothetical protein